MAFREVSVNEIREVLRVWLGVAGLPAPGYRTIAAHCGVDRKTVRRYVEAAQAAGLSRSDGVGAVDDGLIGAVADAVRPVRPDGHGAAWEQLIGFEEQITAWVAGDGEQRPLTITKIHTLLARQGCVAPYRTLHRFASERCGFGRKDTTVRVADGDPGVECQIDFGYLGMLTDAEDGRRRKVHALILTAVYSRHMFVWLSYSQTLAAVIAGCQAAWEFFGGVFAVLIPDNLKPVIAAADAVNPRFTQGWLDYAGHVGFLTDPARVRSPKDKPRVERVVQYVRRNFWDGETFTSLEQAQQAATAWCLHTAGTRIHGSTCARPLEVFTAEEPPQLLAGAGFYDVPVFKAVKVHRDFHAEVRPLRGRGGGHAGALAMASLSAMLRTSPKKWPTRSRSAAMPSGRTATDRPTSAVVVTVISAGRSGIGDPLGRTSVQDSPWGCAIRGSTRVPARLSPALGFG